MLCLFLLSKLRANFLYEIYMMQLLVLPLCFEIKISKDLLYSITLSFLTCRVDKILF